MAVTATFRADFSDFATAVAQAEVQLKSFEADAGKVERALGRMTDSFSGRKVIQDAQLMARAIEEIGGVSKLTENELQRVGATASEAVAKMRAMGLDIPPGLQKIAGAAQSTESGFASLLGPLGNANKLLGLFGVGLSAGAVIAFGQEVLGAADNLTRMADQTGIGIDALQRLQAVAEPSGNSLDQVTAAVSQMQKRLVEGSAETVQALAAISVPIVDLQKLSPDDQFFRIAKGIQGIPDPARQAQAAMALFGKSGAELLPTLKSDIDSLKDSTLRMSEESAKALDDLGDELGRLKTSTLAGFGDMAGSALQFAKSLGELPDALDAVGRAIDDAAAKRGKLSALFTWGQDLPSVSIPGMIGQAPGVPDGVSITAAQRLAIVRGETAFAPGAPKAPQIASLSALPEGEGIDRLLSMLKTGLPDQIEMTKAQAEWAAVLRELDAAAGTASDTVAGMNGEVVEAIKYYLQAGVAQDTLQKAYALTATEVAAVAKKQAEGREVLKLEQDAIAATARLWGEYYAAQRAQGATSIDQQIAEIDRWADAQIAAAERAGTATEGFRAVVEARRQQQQQAALTDFAAVSDAMTTGTKRGLQQLADQAQNTYQEMLKHVGEFSDGTIQHYRDTADAAQMAASAFGTGFEAAGQKASAAVAETVRQVQDAKRQLDMMFAGANVPTADSLSAAGRRPGSFLGTGATPMVSSMLTSVANLPWPARATGGNVSAGASYMVGERGPELFTPGVSGFITPNGGGPNVSVSIQVSGVMDPSTSAQLADAVERELMRRMARRLPGA